MANFEKFKAGSHRKRKLRSKKGLFGTSLKPRLTVHKSARHIYAQLVDDQSCKCITGISSLAKELAKTKAKKIELAGKVGELIAAKAKERGIESILFDRSGYIYHGRVRALAEGARKGGLKF